MIDLDPTEIVEGPGVSHLHFRANGGMSKRRATIRA